MNEMSDSNEQKAIQINRTEYDYCYFGPAQNLYAVAAIPICVFH